MNKIIKSTAVVAAALVTATGVAQLAQADAASAVTIRQTDLIPALADTRSAGHVTFLTDGLHVFTDDATSQAKAAEYFQVTGALPTTASLTWYGTQPQPGQQIVFDFDDIDNNGNDYNILVGEPVYGDNWWLTNGSSTDAKTADPSGVDNNGGNGSDYFGTLAQWKAAMPKARILAGGFSLGSGVKGDGVLQSITYDGTTYGFTKTAAAPVPVKTNVTGYSTVAVHPRSVSLDLFSAAQPANTVLGNKLAWRVTVDGESSLSLKQAFGAHDTTVLRFAKNSGKHVIDVYKNGVHTRHIKITVS